MKVANKKSTELVVERKEDRRQRVEIENKVQRKSRMKQREDNKSKGKDDQSVVTAEHVSL